MAVNKNAEEDSALNNNVIKTLPEAITDEQAALVIPEKPKITDGNLLSK